MARVTKSSSILHKQAVDLTVDSWDKLIFSAESEMSRIAQRIQELKKAVVVFKKKKGAGERCPAISNTMSTTLPDRESATAN